ncbi:hypothetical protein [Candidatus Nitrososphaera gargensis]|uniref:hypothetical protein n=1 Tax=Candidatus Nitrososphaera gargensis TaxID=497727 RepID=UPI001E505E4F|nr:hypothetical protein [Candidatus Nitrososphaera gargensis]
MRALRQIAERLAPCSWRQHWPAHAYKKMIERGFRTDMQGVAMQRPNELGYNLPDISYLIDDWR